MTVGTGGMPDPERERRDRSGRSASMTDTPPQPLGSVSGPAAPARPAAERRPPGPPEQGYGSPYPEQRGPDASWPPGPAAPGPRPIDHPSHPDLPRVNGRYPAPPAPPPPGPPGQQPAPPPGPHTGPHGPPPVPTPPPGQAPGGPPAPGAPTGPVPTAGPANPPTAPIEAPEAAAPAEDDSELDDSDLESAGLEEADEQVADGWALVKATQEGDVDAFGRLFDRYHDVVFRFVFYRLGDRGVAEDLTQETFVRAFRRITSVSYQGRDIGAWFVTIARNLVLDHVKSSRYRLEQATPEITDVAPDSHRPGPESEVIAGATHEELLRCVAKLGEDQQECITLRFLQGLSVSETAHIMGRNEGAVKALQHRAVRRLAQLLPEGLR
jgi:RNA polymerase sigma-70 factor, ECF subfamily